MKPIFWNVYGICNLKIICFCCGINYSLKTYKSLSFYSFLAFVYQIYIVWHLWIFNEENGVQLLTDIQALLKYGYRYPGALVFILKHYKCDLEQDAVASHEFWDHFHNMMNKNVDALLSNKEMISVEYLCNEWVKWNDFAGSDIDYLTNRMRGRLEELSYVKYNLPGYKNKLIHQLQRLLSVIYKKQTY